MSNLTLQQIIQVIKASALDPQVGFVKVEEKKVVDESIADSEIPAMLIGLSKVEYDKFLITTVLEKYFFTLIIFVNNSTDPVSDLKTLQDKFLTKFLGSDEMCDYVNSEKIQLTVSSLTNNRQNYSKLGGETTELSFTIENTNSFTN